MALVLLCNLSVVANYRQPSAFYSLLIFYHYQLYLFGTLRIAGISKPENLKVENGLSSGQLFVTVKAVKGAYAYLHEYTTDATIAPGSCVTTNTTTSRYMLNNLQPGTVYYCRVGAIGSNNQLLYSDAVSRMVI